MRLRHNYYLAFLGYLSLLLPGCNLEKDIDVALPPYESQMVVECYLEPGKYARLTLLESSGYLESPSIIPIEAATVTISFRDTTINLIYRPFRDDETGKYYTHSSGYVMKGKPGEVFTLNISDPKGRILTGTTTVLPTVKIDTVEFNFNDREEALILTRFKDEGSTEDYYRYSVHKDSLGQEAEISYTSPDELTNGEPIAFGTGFDFESGDTIIVSLHHLEKAFFDFQESVEEAQDANGNPFAQPGRVKSTVQGGLGVFTNLVYDRRTLMVTKKP